MQPRNVASTDRRTFVATALTYVAPYEAVHRQIAGKQLVLELSAMTSEEVPLVIPCVGGGCIYSMTVMIRVEMMHTSIPRILSARARLSKDELAARENRIFEIPNILETSRALGMQTLDSSIKQLFVNGYISREDAIAQSAHPEKLERSLAA